MPGYHSRNKIGVAENWPEFANHFEECYAAIVMPKANISFQTKIEAMLVASVQAQSVHLQAESAYCLHRMGVRTERILNLFDFENHAAAFTDKELQTYRFFKNAGVMPEQSKAADIDRLLNVVSQRNAFGYHDRDKLEFWMHFPEFSNPFWDIDNMITLGTEHVSMKQMLLFSAAIATANQAVHTQAHVIRGFEILMANKNRFGGLYDLKNNAHLYRHKELAGIRFMRAAAHLPGKVTAQHLDALRKYYSDKGVANILW